MDLVSKLMPEDYSDRLFIMVLGTVLSFYFLLTCLFIVNKSTLDPFAQKAKLPKRITQLIINLPKPVKKKPPTTPKRTKKPLKEQLAETKPLQKVKKPPAIPKKQPKKIAPKKVAASAKKTKIEKVRKSEAEIDIESLGMLSLVGVIDNTEPALDVTPLIDFDVLTIDDIADFQEADGFHVGEQPEEIESLASVDEKARELTADLDEEFDTANGFDVLFAEHDFLDIEQSESVGEYASDGTRNSKIIQQIVSEYTNGMKFCYNNSLRKAGTLKGTVIVKFTILGSGMTDKVSIISNEISDQRLEHCIIGIIFRWEFPPSKIDKLVVTYPISFVKTS